ncbi:glycosyltransferase family 2 protein [Culicoidibacter larvae]|uniref:Glycosyltransferase n=1 Tax=Culicoidibacter larvae TaxID=2579976 RepID=A0A5R8QID7_9FIRM|nr:glycosyltransferase [Culicoidibacter larvae]TLG77450.1 glycosyltransferase [Culicoidibacter larvae]
MAKVSVIISVYNTSSRLAIALDSLLAQTFADFEVILINDGSSDDSLSILEKYSQKDERIQLFDRTNHGISASRNFGLSKATGEYIYFMDSDDKLELTMLEQMVDFIELNNLDAVRVNFLNIYRNGKRKINPYFFKLYEVVMPGMQYFCTDAKLQRWNMQNMTWMWMIRHEVIKASGVQFPEQVKVLEDVAFMAGLLAHCERVGTIEKPLYQYIQYEQSLTNTLRLKQTEADAKAVAENLVQLSDDQIEPHATTLRVYAWMLRVLSLKIYRRQAFGQKVFCKDIRSTAKELPLKNYISFWQRFLLRLHPAILVAHLWLLEYADRLGDKFKKVFRVYSE